jgi:hypothetical protein
MAKKAKQANPEGTPKKRGALARRRRARKVSAAPRSNPPPLVDFTHVILPGFMSYAGTRVVQRVTYNFIQSRWPQFGKHAAAASGIAAFGAAYFFAHKLPKVGQYHDGIVLGSAMAAFQGAARAWLPEKYAWLLSDSQPTDVQQLPSGNGTSTSIPVTTTPAVTAGDEYDYLESALEEAQTSKRVRTVSPPKKVGKPVAQAMAAVPTDGGELDPDLSEELGGAEDVDDLYSGTFEQN